jgi:type IV pilus assembly protein PilY1
MNRRTEKPATPRLARVIAFAALAYGVSFAAGAALIDVAQAPLSSASSTVVKPNISFVLDTSGSMAWSHAPDEAEPFFDKFGYKTSQCNSIYYNPTINYVPPKNSDGTNFPNASFTGAWVNGYNTGAGTVNLATSFYAYDNTSGGGNGSDPTQPAYYYNYLGTQTPDFINTASQFYQECNLPMANGPTAKITVSGSSGTSVSSITVNGVSIMSAGTSSSNTSSTVASRIAAAITVAGYSATVSGSTVTITGPNSAATFTPVITKSGTMTITPTAFAPFNKVVVSATSGPLATDERTNFANWFSYYRYRILMMKSGAGRAFVSVSPNYRVGFMTIYATPSSSTTDPNYLRINDFDATQKAAWYSKFYAENPSGSTPLKAALSTAGRNFAGTLGPDPIQYSCQQNFLILTTDGYWNAGSANPKRIDGSTDVGNVDNNIGTTARPLYDGGLAGSTNTLADGAAYYYLTDLRPGVPGSPACATGVSGADVCQDNVPVSGLDNASWQHMTTFTLGLGTNGTLKYTPDYLTGGSVDYNAIIAGSKNWPSPVGDTLTTIDDLWHAAVNGHGQYFSAKNPDLLVNGLRTALAGVSAREAAGAAAATSNLEPVAGDNFAFIANYRTVKWDGDVEAKIIDVTTGIFSGTSVWSAQTQLDGMVTPTSDTRRIITRGAGGVGQRDFVPGSFSAAEKSAYFTPTAAPALSQASGWLPLDLVAATPDSLINYLRGQWSLETRATNLTRLYRDREHVMGDIIDGKPVYVRLPPFNYSENAYQTFKAGLSARQPVVYVAANDGMLHAVDANTGNELWAYVPSFSWPKMKQLADSGYGTAHQFLTDGAPTISDIYTGSSWKTILVAGLNGGGNGYYALDITTPASPVVLWEFTDVNMGLTFGNPVVGKTADGVWSVFVTSGYNNADGVGRLYVINAATGALRFTISTGVGTAVTPSGLGRIAAWVDDGLNDNTIQRVYGGDMFGNLWRFDVNDIIPPGGKDAFNLFQTRAGAYVQPITAKPELALVGTKPVVYVGTGRYLGTSDITDLGQQTLYAVKDDLSATGIGNASTAGCMVTQTLAVLDSNTRVVTSNNPVDLNTKCGWKINFNPANNTPGERINVDMKLQLGVLGVITNIPENSVCTIGGSSFVYFFDFAKGTNVGDFVEVTDVNGVPSAHASNKVGERIGSSTAVGMNTYRLPDGRVITTVTTSDGRYPAYGNPTYSGFGLLTRRVLWRELLN